MSGGGGREPFPGSDGRRGRRCVRGALRAVRSHVGTESVERECGGGVQDSAWVRWGSSGAPLLPQGSPGGSGGSSGRERPRSSPGGAVLWVLGGLCAALCGSGPTRALSLQKYYPPDFDPAKIPKLKLPKDRQYVVRLMAPFNMR